MYLKIEILKNYESILPTYVVERKLCELSKLELFSSKTEVEKYFKPNIWNLFSLYINSRTQLSLIFDLQFLSKSTFLIPYQHLKRET